MYKYIKADQNDIDFDFIIQALKNDYDLSCKFEYMLMHDWSKEAREYLQWKLNVGDKACNQVIDLYYNGELKYYI